MVIELAQQIAWLTCALRCPPTGLTVAACYPALTVNRVSDTNKHSEVVLVSCRIENIFKQHEPSSTDSDGRCWESLFRSNVLASGFPISARTLPNTGIELSMGVLAQLLHTRQAVQIGSRIILKGFASLVVATLATAGMIVWHVLHQNGSDGRISYADPRLDQIDFQCAQELSLRELQNKRHLVGWCGSVSEICGKFLARF